MNPQSGADAAKPFREGNYLKGFCCNSENSKNLKTSRCKQVSLLGKHTNRLKCQNAKVFFFGGR